MSIMITLTVEELKTIIKDAISEYEESKKTQKKQKPLTVENSFNNVCINIINFMNLRCNKNFKHTKANIDIISERLKSKELSICEAIGIINAKADEWLDSDMDKYLRLSTLFNKTNANNYVGLLGSRYIINEEHRMSITKSFIESELSNEELKKLIRSKNSIKTIDENAVLL